MVDQLFRGQASTCQDFQNRDLLTVNKSDSGSPQTEIFHTATFSTPLSPAIPIFVKVIFLRQPEGEQPSEIYFYLTGFTPEVELQVIHSAPLPPVTGSW
jgi:hypothetical protein